MAISEKSLANLKTISSPEMANEDREKGLVTRIENKKKRELAKENILAMKELGEEAPSAIEALKYVLTQAMESNDTEQIIKVSSILAEYQAPKLSRQDVTQTNINAEDLTDEELEKELEGLTLN
jgi:1,4-dihydroxy-2-naphthoyl-CoA synthase